jgi:ferredoxin
MKHLDSSFLRLILPLLLVLSVATVQSAPAAPLPGGPVATANSPAASADDFQPIAQADEFTSLESPSPAQPRSPHEFRGEARAFHWVLGILFATVVAGLLVRFSVTRNLRAVFLTASVALLGFYKGACPCPIQSLQYSVLNFLGHDYKWQTLVYLLGLLPITYVFGRVFCGWICHLGAVQEFLFLGSRFRLLQSAGAQRAMRLLRAAALLGLIGQLFLTQTNLYKKVDPFAVLFNFTSPGLTGWLLLALLVVASVLIHRPFCKTVCPVGLILGWVSKLPGASVLGPNHQCLGCSACHGACQINAITRDGKRSILENQECIRCGDCLDQCRKSSLTFHRKGRHAPDRVELACTAAAATAPLSAKPFVTDIRTVSPAVPAAPAPEPAPDRATNLLRSP